MEESQKAQQIESSEWKKAMERQLRDEMQMEMQKTKKRMEKERDEELEIVVQRFDEEKEVLESNLRRRIVQLGHEKEKLEAALTERENTIHQKTVEILRFKEDQEDHAAKCFYCVFGADWIHSECKSRFI